MTSILDEFPFPFADPRAQELHVTLARLYPIRSEALSIAERAGVDTMHINAEQAVFFIWRDILQKAGAGELTRKLVTVVRDLLNDKNPRRAMLDALLAGTPPSTENEPRDASGRPRFISGDDAVTEPEALLFRDDLTVQIGRVPALIETLRRLVGLAPSVCRLSVQFAGAEGTGTGFRIADDLLLTNWHVVHLATGERASSVNAEFGYEDDGKGGVVAATAIACDVASIVTDQADDWAVIKPSQALDPAWPIVKLSEAVDPAEGEAAYIVQHPRGFRKRLGYVRNQVSGFDDRVVHYLTDTEDGSSGSPVFNAAGRLIGLHHAGGTPQELIGRPPLIKNEGIRIPRVVEGLAQNGIQAP